MNECINGGQDVAVFINVIDWFNLNFDYFHNGSSLYWQQNLAHIQVGHSICWNAAQHKPAGVYGLASKWSVSGDNATSNENALFRRLGIADAPSRSPSLRLFFQKSAHMARKDAKEAARTKSALQTKSSTTSCSEARILRTCRCSSLRRPRHLLNSLFQMIRQSLLCGSDRDTTNYRQKI